MSLEAEVTEAVQELKALSIYLPERVSDFTH